MAAKALSAFKTEARFAYDEKFLYVAITCNHPTGMKVDPVVKRTRDADLAGHDRVDVLLDLDRDYQTYYRFQIDHRGCLAEDCWGDRSWNPKYFAAFKRPRRGGRPRSRIPGPGTDRRPTVARQDVGRERVADRAEQGRAGVERPGRRQAPTRGHGPAAIPGG